MYIISILIFGLIVKFLLNYYDNVQNHIKQADQMLEILREMHKTVNDNNNKLKNIV